ncbi:MAG: divalent-cation tolerance protein CutA [Alphaproteobacteria bacterium]|nr:divalent-cation tolerance protein CutA [Alphaproteobacteria bacterium]
MQSDDTPVIVYTTFPDITSAKNAGSQLIAANLAACVNILPGMVSIYQWDGKQESSEEVVMIVKTRSALAQAVVGEVSQQHPYDTPAVLTWQVTGGAPTYIEWIAQMTKP